MEGWRFTVLCLVLHGVHQRTGFLLVPITSVCPHVGHVAPWRPSKCSDSLAPAKKCPGSGQPARYLFGQRCRDVCDLVGGMWHARRDMLQPTLLNVHRMLTFDHHAVSVFSETHTGKLDIFFRQQIRGGFCRTELREGKALKIT